jgi:hypothetical protein
MGRVEVLHQNEGHAVIGRQRTQKFPASIEATRRGANANNGEVTNPGRRAACERTSARSRRGGCGLVQLAIRHLGLSLGRRRPAFGSNDHSTTAAKRRWAVY